MEGLNKQRSCRNVRVRWGLSNVRKGATRFYFDGICKIPLPRFWRFCSIVVSMFESFSIHKFYDDWHITIYISNVPLNEVVWYPLWKYAIIAWKCRRNPFKHKMHWIFLYPGRKVVFLLIVLFARCLRCLKCALSHFYGVSFCLL